MKILSLDETLKLPAQIHPGSLDPILDGTIPHDRRKYVEYTARGAVCDWLELRVRHGVPQKAALYHASYIEYLFDTWSRHLPFVVAPQHIWHAVLCEVAEMVRKKPEAFRDAFTTSQDKQEILLNAVGDLLPLQELTEALEKIVPGGMAHILLPRFSCDTTGAWYARMAAFADACATYYDYSMQLCGHPRAKVLGTPEDWERLRRHVVDLRGRLGALHAGAGSYLRRVEKVLEPFFGTDEELAAHLRGIVTGERCGSGHEHKMDGWWASLYVEKPGFPKLENFPRHIARVPYKVLQNGQPDERFVLCAGLFFSQVDEDGFYVPDYAWAQNKVLDAPVRQVESQWVARAPEAPIEVG